jgi:hypothetical protein
VLTADVIAQDNIFVPSKQNMNTSSKSNRFQRRDKFDEGQSSQGATSGRSQVFNPNSQEDNQIYVEKI